MRTVKRTGSCKELALPSRAPQLGACVVKCFDEWRLDNNNFLLFVVNSYDLCRSNQCSEFEI